MLESSLRERDIHRLIEEENPEEKQRVWEKVLARLEELGLQCDFDKNLENVKNKRKRRKHSRNRKSV